MLFFFVANCFLIRDNQKTFNEKLNHMNLQCIYARYKWISYWNQQILSQSSMALHPLIPHSPSACHSVNSITPSLQSCNFSDWGLFLKCFLDCSQQWITWSWCHFPISLTRRPFLYDKYTCFFFFFGPLASFWFISWLSNIIYGPVVDNAGCLDLLIPDLVHLSPLPDVWYLFPTVFTCRHWRMDFHIRYVLFLVLSLECCAFTHCNWPICYWSYI